MKYIIDTEKGTCEKYEEDQQQDKSIFWQQHPRYKGLKLGKSNTSMQQFGCFLMCWAYVSGWDPIELNKHFTEHGVYSNDLINEQKACEVLGFEWVTRSYDINYMPKQELTIKEVYLGKGQHFVVRINENDKRTIFDPWEGRVLPINHYKFKSYRVFNI